MRRNRDEKVEMAESLPEIMTIQEVAAYLRISVSTVTKNAKSGEIPGKLLGSSWRFSRKMIEKMMEQVKSDA